MCQEDLIAEILEDLFIYFKDKMAPQKEEEQEPDYDLNFAEIVVPQNYQECDIRKKILKVV